MGAKMFARAVDDYTNGHMEMFMHRDPLEQAPRFS